VITARSVSYRIADRHILDDVSLELRPRESVALVGPSGSGKSTLLYCLSGVLRPDSGSILLDGQDLTVLADRELSDLRAKCFGFVLQFGRLVPELSALENVTIPLRLTGMRAAKARSRARDALDEVGVAHLAEQRSSSLSGGEQQRVAVARAVVHEPPFVFADEPTGALDSENSLLVMECLERVVSDHGSSLLVVTHAPDVAARADRCIQMVDGVAEPQLVAP
jgi:putative ABC transport system ATP-binding protein